MGPSCNVAAVLPPSLCSQRLAQCGREGKRTFEVFMIPAPGKRPGCQPCALMDVQTGSAGGLCPGTQQTSFLLSHPQGADGVAGAAGPPGIQGPPVGPSLDRTCLQCIFGLPRSSRFRPPPVAHTSRGSVHCPSATGGVTFS